MMYTKKFKLVICIPASSIIIQTVNAVDKLVEQIEAMPNCEFLGKSIQYFPGVEAARNKVLGLVANRGSQQKCFQGTPAEDYTHILWIDHDMEPTFDQFEVLLNHDLDVVAGIYCTSDGALCLGAFGPESNDATRINSFRTKELHRVAFSGLGFMLMKKGVIESVGNPPFRWEPQHSETIYMPWHGTEDVNFGQRVRKAGFDIWVDPTVMVPHWKQVPMLPQESGIEKFTPIVAVKEPTVPEAVPQKKPGLEPLRPHNIAPAGHGKPKGEIPKLTMSEINE